MEESTKKNKIILTGGGTGGSVSPLLAIYNHLQKDDDFEFVFVGTKDGIEKDMVQKADLQYKSIISGKLRRYFSWKNFIDPFKIIFAFFQSINLIVKERPKMIISAGSFVSVPFVWAGWIMRVPILIHQMDIRPGLANKLMAPFATKITVTFEKSLKDYGEKSVWTGNPISLQKENKKSNLKLDEKLPSILILGGGTGAGEINNLVEGSIDKLAELCKIVHVTGKGKALEIKHKNYHQFEFLDQRHLYYIMDKVDLVITRAGIGTLTEISYFKKVAIIIPIPDSHQEDNAQIFENKEAAIVLNEKDLDGDKFVLTIKNIFKDKNLQKKLIENVEKISKKNATGKIVRIMRNILK